MKPDFKTTAVAILVALGVTACKSDTKRETAAMQINQQAQQAADQSHLEAEQKAKDEAARKAKAAEEKARIEKEKAELAAKHAAEAKAKAEQEAEEKAQEQARLDAERKAQEEAARKAKAAEEKARLEREAAEKAALAKKAEADRLKAEAEAKAQEQARLDAERKAQEQAEREAKAAEEKARLEREAAEKEVLAKKAEADRLAAEEKARLEEEKLAKEQLEKEANKEKVRIEAELAQIPMAGKIPWEFKLNIMNAQEPNLFIEYSMVDTAQDLVSLPEPYKGQTLRYNSPFETLPLLDSDHKINFTEITKKDIHNGGKYLGKHEGSWSDPAINGVIVTTENRVTNDKVLNGAYIGKEEPLDGISIDDKSNTINYIFINNPYSTYGVLFTNEHDQKHFYKGIKTQIYGSLYERVNEDTSEIKYIDSLKGDVTYKGDVIATITRGVPGSEYGTIQDLPKVDGKITLNAHFGSFKEENSIKGQLVSDTVGTIDLLPTTPHQTYTNTHYGNTFSGKVEKLDNGKDMILGGYKGALVGKDGQDIVGQVGFKYYLDYVSGSYDPNWKFQADKDGKNPIAQYDAVFGATKQPK